MKNLLGLSSYLNLDINLDELLIMVVFGPKTAELCIIHCPFHSNFSIFMSVLNHREADELNITIPSKAHEELLKILRSALAANEKNLQTVLNYIGQDNSGFSRKWHEVMEGTSIQKKIY